MRYVSTRGQAPHVGFVDAVLGGLAPDGGLYVPQTWPLLRREEIAGFAGAPYAEVAARVIGVPSWKIMMQHVLPNVMGPVLVLATLGLGIAILTEATLSFLGVGLPATEPSLGALVRIGQNFLFSGEWWIVAFPSVALATLILAVNILGDWLRDALNPRLK